MPQKSWIQSFNAILIGLSFLITALVQITIHYYSTTLDEVHIFLKSVIFLAIIGIGVFLIDVVFFHLLDNIKRNLPKKISRVYEWLFRGSLVIMVLAIAFLVILSSPKAILYYGFTCPDELRNFTMIELVVVNRGSIFGDYKFYSTSSEEWINFRHNLKDIREEKPGLFTINPESETAIHQIYINLGKDISQVDVDNITMSNTFSCTIMDCREIRYSYTEDECVYEKVGLHYKKTLK